MTATTIGVITDAHANLPALDAALAALDRAGCDLVVHTGDAIGLGPHPAECLDRLLARPRTLLLMGNHDAWFAHGLPDPQPDWMRDDQAAHNRWTHAQLDPGLRALVAAWPIAITCSFGSLTVRFCHYAPAPEGDGFAPIIPDPTAADLDRLFGPGLPYPDLLCYGHHHPTSDLRGRSRYVNPGALGCHRAPRARFAVVRAPDDGAPEVRLGSAPYDPAPLWDDFARRRVPAREIILPAFFGRPGRAPG